MIKKNNNIVNRPPVVVVMGHVDHGKSSILEAIKDLKITSKESGGITQHIGAYEVEHQSKKITFLDTPGHEAFSSMRSRGAKVADLAVLVVAADDGVKAQTKEAIVYIKKAEIPMIVAVNKIDKPEADPDRVTQQLASEEIYLESIGGKVPSVAISAKTKKNINELLEMILLVSEMENLKTDASLLVSGVVVESQIDSLKGPTATVIVETGTLRKGDIIATSSASGRVKSIGDFQGKPAEEALPSMPAVVHGFSEVPLVGDKFKVFPNIQSASDFVKENRSERKRLRKEPVPGTEMVNIIVKADFLGSLEAIEEMFLAIPQDRVLLNILKSEVGDINESDVKLAKSARAIILGFRVKTIFQIGAMIEREGVTVLTFEVIYELIEKTRKIMERAITPRIERVDIGKAKTLALFFHDKNHQIIGCKVIEGELRRGAELEVMRVNAETNEEHQIGKGKIGGIKRGTKETEKIGQGEECGISYEGDVKVEIGDILAAYLMEKEKIEGV